jgi:hypothetical protein
MIIGPVTGREPAHFSIVLLLVTIAAPTQNNPAKIMNPNKAQAKGGHGQWRELGPCVRHTTAISPSRKAPRVRKTARPYVSQGTFAPFGTAFIAPNYLCTFTSVILC